MTALDLTALSPEVTILGTTLVTGPRAALTSTPVTGFSDVASVTIVTRVERVDNSNGELLSVTVQGSDDGVSWSTVAGPYTFAREGTQTATLGSPADRLRVTWAAARGVREATIGSVTARLGVVDSRPFISDSEPGIVVNRAGGFVSDWEEFDLLEPGAGYGEMTVTAADSDGLVWGVDVVPNLEIEMSVDGTTWLPFYGSAITVAAAFTLVHKIDLGNPVLVGQKLAYVALVPRAVRFRGTLLDSQSGALYAGADDPAYTYTFAYTAS